MDNDVMNGESHRYSMPPHPGPSDPALTVRYSRRRRKDTQPELALRRALHAVGLRYRVIYPVPGRSRRSIDIAFPRQELAVFVDGCFWHGCPEHGTSPRSNSRWWSEKIQTNRERDADTDSALAAAGWRVLRVWEHEEPVSVVRQVATELNRPDVLRLLSPR